MKRVLVFGTFDLLHHGHRNFLAQARELGNRLIASIARDEFVKRVKGRSPFHSIDERISKLLEENLVDEAYPSDKETGNFNIVEKIKPDIICLGYDQLQLKNILSNWIKENNKKIKIKILKSYKKEKYKTSIIFKTKNKGK